MTQRPFPVIPVLTLTLAALACSVSFDSSDNGVTPIPEPVEPATEEPTDEVPPEPAQTEEPVDPGNPPAPTATISASIPPEGAFITTPNDSVNGLPEMTIPPTGIGGVFCEGATDGNTSFRLITKEFGLLCLYGLNTEIGAPAITVNVVAPDGTSYVQTYNIIDDGGNPGLFDPHGNRGGNVYGEDLYGEGGFEPAIGIDFFTGAYIPAGQWTVAATTADNSVTIPATPFIVQRNSPIVSDAPVPGFSPLDHSHPTYSSGDTIYFYGAAYTPGQTIRLALYTADPGGATSEFGTAILVPRNATTLTVDANGRFEAAFVVGTTTLTGGYYAITDDQFDADFEASGFMKDPFVGAFTID